METIKKRNYIVAIAPLNLEQKVIGTYFHGKIRKD